MDVRFRRMIAEDAPAVHALEALCFQNPTEVKELRAIARMNLGASHICTLHDELVGHAVAFGRRGIWWIQSVCVSPKYRRSRFGSELLRKVWKDVPANRPLQVLVCESSDPGIAFFRTNQFQMLKLLDRLAENDGPMLLMLRRK